MKTLLRTALAKALHRVGAVAISNREYAELKQQRAIAVAELTAVENRALKPGLTGVVFSKDRALQLHALLASYTKLVKQPAGNPVPLTVIYNASSVGHAKAYRQVAKLFPKVTFTRETKKFREHLLVVLNKTQTSNIFFLVDDIVFIRPLDLKLAAQINPLETVLSFRLAPSIIYSFTCAKPHNGQPVFKPSKGAPGLVEFNWQPDNYEWSYPYSVDGHVFSTAEIRVLVHLSAFKAPNTFEGALMAFADLALPRRGLCYTQAKLVNLPINKVQTENANLAGNVSPGFLLARWNEGLTLDTAAFQNLTPTSPHMELPVAFTKRSK